MQVIKKFIGFILSILGCLVSNAQVPPSITSADIYLQLEKLKVLGSVLYIAAHPDDENSRLLAYLSKERLYRTGYLSLTRGDGGQNLIGDEQGVDLGLIRTQELLAARRIDGAEQFFSRAFDFGFSKRTEESFEIWGKEKILSDVVWVIRKFQPDVIITRFPEDARAGHGQHSGSAVLAHEAFRAAADPARFPDQFKYGVQPWQAKRILWNTFNFGGTNTTDDSQLKLDVGAFNPVLGKSIGEIAAESRSQHKSQGFGISSSRGQQIEFFSLVEGAASQTDIMEAVDVGWKRVAGGQRLIPIIDDVLKNYSLSHPEHSVPALVNIYKELNKLPAGFWKTQKLQEVQRLIEVCSGLWLEGSSASQFAVQGDSLRVNISVNDRLGSTMALKSISILGFDSTINVTLDTNRNYNFSKVLYVADSIPITQPYWLQQKMSEGSFNVDRQDLISNPESDPPIKISFELNIAGNSFTITKPVKYKFTDPVKGELYEPLAVIPPITISTEPGLIIFNKNEEKTAEVLVEVRANRNFSNYKAVVSGRLTSDKSVKTDSAFSLSSGATRNYLFTLKPSSLKGLEQDNFQAFAELKNGKNEQPANLNITSIKYGHIPDIYYFYQDGIKLLNIDLKISGRHIGYIEGAGDKVVGALQQMGYDVVILKEHDINSSNLKQFDAIITGVRAYNIHPFLIERYNILMEYIRNGGNLIVQYNTNSQVGPIRSRIGPYPFNISRNRVTDEKAPVSFLLPDHPVFNYPNKIAVKDFENWMQERSIYLADQIDSNYKTPLLMNDPGEDGQNGSLIIADYGKGKFVYTGLVFFRELPAGVPGAYRLLANIIALNKKKGF